MLIERSLFLKVNSHIFDMSLIVINFFFISTHLKYHITPIFEEEFTENLLVCVTESDN